MPGPDEQHGQLDASRAELLALVRELPHETIVWRPDGASNPDDERWAIRDVLWHVGEQEQRWHRWMTAAARGEQLDDFSRQPRPARVNTLPQLLDWLDETRSATLTLLDGLDAAELERPRPSPWNVELSFERVAGLLTRHDRSHAEQVSALLEERPNEP